MHYKNNVRMNQYHDMLKNGNSIFRKIRVKIENAAPIAAAAPPSPALSPQTSLTMRLQAILDAAKAKRPKAPPDPLNSQMTYGPNRSPKEQRNFQHRRTKRGGM